jgi:hypothetical protein
MIKFYIMMKQYGFFEKMTCYSRTGSTRIYRQDGTGDGGPAFRAAAFLKNRGLYA